MRVTELVTFRKVHTNWLSNVKSPVMKKYIHVTLYRLVSLCLEIHIGKQGQVMKRGYEFEKEQGWENEKALRKEMVVFV